MKHVDREISAYLDGECKRPDLVEQHLAQCPQCASRLQELQRLGNSLRQLQAPEVRPEFVTRVIARAAEPAPHAFWHWFRWIPVAVAACAMIAFLAVSVLRPKTLEKPLIPDERMANLLDQHLNLDTAEDSTWALASAADFGTLEIPEDMVVDLANVDLAGFAEDFTSPADVETIVNDMNPVERAVFKQLLENYGEEV